MAIRTLTQFQALYGTNSSIFIDNTTQEISEADMRAFGQDISDSFATSVSSEDIASWKEPCRVATTANITLSGEQTIDTVAAVTGDRVLVQFQSTASQNGIYVVAVGAWSRSTDADIAAELEGAAVAVNEGATYFNKIFFQETDNITLGTSSISWVPIGTTSGISGLTTNRIPYATSATTLGDDSSLTWDATNNAITVGSARFHTRGALNTFIGQGAGNFTLSGTANTGFGYATLIALTSGVDNTAVGTTVLAMVTTGQGNVAIGSGTLAALVTGSGNTAIGSGALSSVTVNNNIGIGTGAGTNITTGAQNIIIGSAVSAPSATANGQLVIQNIIFGVGNTTTGTGISTGQIGIGENAPTRKLEVAGSLAIKAGTSTGQLARVGGVLNTNTTTTGNVTTGEDTLFTYTVPANVLSTNHDTIVGTFAGTCANNANSKTIKLKFGSTTITYSLSVGSPTEWSINCEIIRTGAATQKIATTFFNSASNYVSTYTTAAETLSGTVALVLTGEATDTNDIVFEMGKVRWEPAE